ncbi:MAG: hypothetical protein IPH44_25345 [Myxococcales bacterium]|nr:hypothetical protein [Myxococcales bacterium]MBK7191727.1 hypothetical protein [Myxococcales bacterium]MBP6842676.1 hypothetical protein [Kofleriaceae bacterium]
MSLGRRAHDRAWRWLAGADGLRPGLPCAELLAPVPLAAIALVAINDWWWKPHATLPATWTGKLSDVGGVIALPLVLTAALALALRAAARLGAPVDWTLRRWKLGLALALTAAAVAATKLSPDVAATVASLLGKDAQIYVDRSDLLVLPALVVPWWHGRRTIARVPYGRVAWIVDGRRAPSAALVDVQAAGADPAQVAALAAALAAPIEPAAVAAALAAIRDRPGGRPA